MTEVFILLILFQVKHFIADYPLQGKYMLGKFKPGYDFIIPLSAHCFIHFILTFNICLVFTNNFKTSLYLSLFDFIIHFIMDRIKASPNMLGRFKPLSAKDMIEIMSRNFNNFNSTSEYKRVLHSDKIKLKHNTYFWWSLGLDQAVHHLTHYFIIYMVVTNV